MGSDRSAVIFDLDGVITDTAEFHYQGWQRLADEEGIPFDRQGNESLRGLSRRESLLTMLGDRHVDEDRLVEMMERKNRYYVDFLGDMEPHDVLPGAIALVVEARRRGLAVAIGSSSRNARRVLAQLQLTDLFDAIADGNSVERAKPAPDLFLAAAELLARPAERCVVVEDAGSGVDAALAAGMLAVGIGPVDRVGHADLRFETVEAVDLARVVPPRDSPLPDGTNLRDGWVVMSEQGGVITEDGLRYGDRRVTDRTGSEPVVDEQFEPLSQPGTTVRRRRRGDAPWVDVEDGDHDEIADEARKALEGGYEVALGRHAIACERWWAEVLPEDLPEGVEPRRRLLEAIRAGADSGEDPRTLRSVLRDERR